MQSVDQSVPSEAQGTKCLLNGLQGERVDCLTWQWSFVCRHAKISLCTPAFSGEESKGSVASYRIKTKWFQVKKKKKTF